jgi:hypothetical protein
MKALKWTTALLIFFFCGGAKAQKIGGGEIYYQLLSGKKYLVTAHVYRQCDQASLKRLDGFVMADTFRIPMNFVRTGIQRINDTCGDPCNITNAVSRKGFEKHTFEDTVDFSQDPYEAIKTQKLCEVRFAIYQKLRDTTINAHTIGTGMFYLDAMVNICLNFQNVHSPVFSFDPKLLYACNQPVWYTPGPADTLDFDSLSFTLDTPLMNISSPVAYNYNYNVLIPVYPYCPPNPGVVNCRALPSAKPPRGFYFDPELCQMGVTPTKCDEVTTVKFKACEWRRDSSGKFVLIGYVCREMLGKVFQSKDNNPPYFTGLKKYSICNGNTLCFNTETRDEPFLPKQTVTDTVTLFWNHGIPAAKFKITDSAAREKTGQFCWTPSAPAKTGDYHFSTMAWDRICNSSISSSGFLIRHYEKSNFKKSFTLDKCNIIRYQVQPGNSSGIAAGNIIIINAANKTVFYSERMQDSFTLNANGTYYIRYNISSYANLSCSLLRIDTFQVSNALPKGFEFSSADTAVCSSYPLQLGFQPFRVPGISSWSWHRNDTLFSNTDSIIEGIIYGNASYVLNITDTRGCHSVSTRKYQSVKVSQDLVFSSNSYCPGDVKTITAMTDKLAMPVVSRWIYQGIDTTFPGDTYKLLPKGYFFVKLRVTDRNHCINDDLFSLDSLYKPVLALSVNKQKFCADSLVEVSGKLSYNRPVTQTIWRINGVDTITPVTFRLKRSFKDTSEVILRIKGDFLCTHPDTINVKPINNPEVSLSAPAVCTGTSATVRATIAGGLDKKSISWTRDGKPIAFSDTLYSFPVKQRTLFKVKVGTGSLCYAEDTIAADILVQVPLRIESQGSFHRFERVEMQTSDPYASYKWWNGMNTRKIELFAWELGPPGYYQLWCEVQDSNGCIDRDSFYIYTNNYTSIHETEKKVLQVYPNPASEQVIVYSIIEAEGNLYNSEGKLISSIRLSRGKNILNLEGYADGVYILMTGGCGYSVVVLQE